jgi:hypothetical protein
MKRIARLMLIFTVGFMVVRADILEESFRDDPKWEGRNNVPKGFEGVKVHQDFGYSRSDHAGGEVGEIGGHVQRSFRPATYAAAIPVKTLDDQLTASGRFAVTACEGGSGMLFGWHNQTSQGWRTPNSLAMRIDGESSHYRIFFEYGTRNWKTGGGDTFEGAYQTTTTPLFKADGSSHEWSLVYDPAGADGLGEITYTLDGEVYTAALEPGHKEDGATFDRFGIFNQQITGDGMELYFDDLVVDGQSYDFSSDPGWTAMGNRGEQVDMVRRPIHDFGHRETNYAGGEPGEIGGYVWRIEKTNPEQTLAYGAPIGRLTLNDRLHASGRVCLRTASVDSAVLIGWYNEWTPVGTPPANFVGILLEGPSRIGHYFRPAYGNAEGTGDAAGSGPIIHPDGAAHEWTLDYDPTANGGLGSIAVTLDGDPVSIDMPEGVKKGYGSFSHFGVLSWNHGGHFVEVYLDDLSFTEGAQD